MTNYFKKLVYLGKQSQNFIQQRLVLPGLTLHRSISLTTVKHLKEIREEKKDNITTIEGVEIESKRTNKLLPSLHKGACPLCQLNLDVKYTDVLILSQFVSPHGQVLPRTVTNLCGYQHKKVEALVRRAQDAGLLAHFQADGEDGKKPELRSNYKWKKNNIHFIDEKKYSHY
ncbi:hypothetical protein SNE40_009366 [Patella caerulea]|uniref:28S ribosomal protein S18a, mitochondrial n=1 Tax=Patella caerulea TaxID=87958 RepID=A0AAN8JPI9_PATCE